jgi:spore coat polysaccharide biosynthesis protein SpsF
MKRRIVAIIQARMGSTRLPKKVLMPLLGKPVLWHIVQRLRYAKDIDNIVIATSDKERDAVIEEFSKENDIDCFRGNETDVLDRFYQTALKYLADDVIRITADCPLVDPYLIGELINLYYKENYDHCGIATGAGVANSDVGKFPNGLDSEMFKMEVLKTAWERAELPLEREHVTPYIWKRPETFSLGLLMSKGRDYSTYRWTLDNLEDFQLIEWIYEKLYPVKTDFCLHDIANLLSQNKDIMKVNKHLIGQEGYDEFWK